MKGKYFQILLRCTENQIPFNNTE